MNQAGVSQCDHLEVQFPMGKGLRCLAKLLQIQDILNFFKVQLKPSSLFCHEPKLRFVIQTSELRLVRYKQVRYKKNWVYWKGRVKQPMSDGQTLLLFFIVMLKKS